MYFLCRGLPNIFKVIELNHSFSVSIISEVSKVLDEKFGGTFVTCLKEADKSAQKLLSIVLDNFSCFRDVAQFKGKKVSLLKRAQVCSVCVLHNICYISEVM